MARFIAASPKMLTILLLSRATDLISGTGTTFNVRNSSDSTASVVLVEGAVEIYTDSHNCVKMKPNHLVDICAGNITSMRSVNPADYTSWIDYKLHLDGEPPAR